MGASAHPICANSSGKLEDHARLYNLAQTRLGLHHLTVRDRKTFFKNVSWGLEHLGEIRLHATSWAREFEELAASSEDELFQFEKAQPRAELHPLVNVIIGQPAPSRNIHQRKTCMSIGALAVVDFVFNNARPHANFANQLRQLYRSNSVHWTELLQLQRIDRQTLLEWFPKNDSATIVEFKTRLLGMQDIAIPALSSFFDRADTLAVRAGIASVEVWPLNDGRMPNQANSQAVRVDPLSDTTPRLDLFEVQKQRDCQADIVDGYRLPFKWERLHSNELKFVLNKLNAELTGTGVAGVAEARHLQMHAAARYLSLFCGVSLKKCLRLPLGRQGSMKLDIAHGVLRRDLLLVAPRMDIQDRVRINGRWWRTRLPLEVVSVLQQVVARHPGAQSLGDLVKAEGLTYDMCQSFLNKDWPSSHKPEDSRFAMSLRPCLLDLGIHPALVSRITGDTMTTPASDHYYVSFSEHDVHQAVSTFCDFAELTTPNPPTRNRTIGSPKVISIERFKEINQTLNQQVLKRRVSVTPRSSLRDILEFHNFYSCAVALQILWSVGGRCDRIGSLTFERLFASSTYLSVSDRRVDRYSRQRIVPATECISATRAHYLEHLRSLTASLRGTGQKCLNHVAATTSGSRPHESAFLIFTETSEGWQTRGLKRQDLSSLALSLGVPELNIPRHFWFAQLCTLSVSQVGIEALLGHHINGAEAFGYASGISVREVSNYMRPILETVQKMAGFAPLVGRGRQSTRYLDLPDMAVRRSLRHLPSLLLKRKLAIQDFMIPEAGIYEQDPPSDCKTLVAHSQLCRLHKRYLSTDISLTLPLGGLLYALIAFDLVLTPSELKALLAAAVTGGTWAVGRMAVIEGVQDDGRPVVQRIASVHTILAAHQARKTPRTPALLLAGATEEMHRLLKTLNPDWTGRSPQESVDLLTSIASHWAAVEVPAGAMFGVLHKASFVPANDLSRLFYGRPCLPQMWDSAVRHAPSTRQKKGFERTLDIVKKWGNKDIPLGEDHARSKGCVLALEARRNERDVDEIEQALIDLLCADLSPRAPYRRLRATTLPEYARGYEVYFSFAQTEGTFDLDPETWHEVYSKMGGAKDFRESGPVRWQMLHICAFLQQQGSWTPPAFLSELGIKRTTLARLPVYTSFREIAASRVLIEQSSIHQGGTYRDAGPRLLLQREVPVRVSEPRYCRPDDFDQRTGMFHVTSTGHDHLKSSYSRGSVKLSPSLTAELALLRQRKSAINVGFDTLLFADAHLDAPYAAFDATSESIRNAITGITGCKRFRQHDLRCAAITDTCFDFEIELNRRGGGLQLARASSTADNITRKHWRFALGSRMGRHASPLTTLRHYNVAGMMDLAHHLTLAHADLKISSRYLSALTGVNVQAVYAASHRARTAKSQTGSDAPPFTPPLHDRLREFTNKVIDCLPTPPLDLDPHAHVGPSSCTSSKAHAGRLVEACLYCIAGIPAEAASDAVEVPTEMVSELMSRLQQHASDLRVRTVRKDQVPIFSSKLGGHHLQVPRALSIYATWLVANHVALQDAGISLLSCFSKCGSRLEIKSELQMASLTTIWEGLIGSGFELEFRLGENRLISDFPALQKRLSDLHITLAPVHAKQNVFGLMSFLFPERKAEKKVPSMDKIQATSKTHVFRRSPRAYGRAGCLAVGGLLVGLSLHSSKN